MPGNGGPRPPLYSARGSSTLWICSTATGRAGAKASRLYAPATGATGQGEMDLRSTTPLAAMNVCNVPPRFQTLDVPRAQRIAPGEPERSILFRRTRASGFAKMPPVGTLSHDPEGLAVLGDWIRQLKSCN